LRAARLGLSELQAAAASARDGDTTARQVFRAFGADLGAFLAPFVAAFGAEAVLVLGGIAGAFDLFGPQLREALAIPVLPGLSGVHAALIGAAELIFDCYSNEQTY
jgi:glucokinase